MAETEELREEMSSRVAGTAESAKAQAQEFTSAATERAKDMTNRLGHKVREFAGRLRERSPAEKVRATTDQVADRLDSAGTYLEDRGLQGMLDDVAGIIRKYPVQTLLIGIGIGFLLARRKLGHTMTERGYRSE